MDIASPTWNSERSSYNFVLSGDLPKCTSSAFLKNTTPIPTPVPSITFIDEFVNKTKHYFVSSLTTESVLKRLRHVFLTEMVTASLDECTSDWISAVFVPISIEVKNKEFIVTWSLVKLVSQAPLISMEFTGAPSPRAQSPAPLTASEENLRTIQIQNTMDGLITVGDLPLSDLPPLPFYPPKEDEKKKVREARLRVALAKLKAERLAQKYYTRYGQEESDSELSSDSGSDEPFEA